jgi:excisionase family DNA binding protein
MPEPLMSPREVADHLGVPVGTVYQWRVKGTAPRGIKVGKHLRFRPADVEAWVEANSTPTTS